MKQSELHSKIVKLTNINDFGCYFLDLLFVAKGREPELDEMLHYYDLFTENEWMEDDCYVKNPCAILECLTGKKFTVKKDTAIDKEATHVIGHYHNPNTGLKHFVVTDKSNKVVWDSIENSDTVKNGYIESYRLFTEVK